MRPTINELARFFTTAKTNKFEDFKKINVDDVNERPKLNRLVPRFITHLK